MASELDVARARIAALEALCADAYQLAGTVGAPVRFLDALSAAAAGKPLPQVSLLPVYDTECSAVVQRESVLESARQLFSVGAAAVLGRKGGTVTSQAKVSAARANGKKGGRPKLRFQVVVAPPAKGFSRSLKRPAHK